MDVFCYRYNGLYVTWMYFAIGTMGYVLHGFFCYRYNWLYVTWMFFVIGAIGYMLHGCILL